MSLTRGRSFLRENTAPLTRLGLNALARMDQINAAIDASFDEPLRVYATLPTPDSIINIGPSEVVVGDGSIKSAGPSEDTLPYYPGATINAQTGAVGGAGTVLTDGGAFSFPTATAAGRFYRMAYVWDTVLNAFNVTFSDEELTEGALPDPGLLFAALEGQKKGFIDLESTSTTAYKTAGAGTNVILNDKIYRFGGGAGGDGGSVTDFKLQSISGSTATIKKGFQKISDQITLVTGSGTDSSTTNVNLSLDLSTIIASPSDNTSYYLYIDRDQLGSPIFLTDNGRKVLRVYDVSHFALKTETPDELNPDRFIEVGGVHTADTGNAYTGTGAFFWTKAIPLHDSLSKAFALTGTKKYQIVTSTASDITAHGLSGKPTVSLTYFDGVKEKGIDVSNHLLDVDETNIEISTLGLTFGGGEYVEVTAKYTPETADVLGFSGDQFVSNWFTDTATTTLPHNLSDMDDIRGYVVQEWDIVSGRRRNLILGSLVTNFDDTNFYLDWLGLTPSANLQYRVVAGSRALPIAVPLNIGGYTKFVGFGPGSYATLAAAFATCGPGDSILVVNGYSISSAETLACDDVKVTFMPGVQITVTGGTSGLVVTGDRCQIISANYLVDFAGTLTNGIKVDGDDCEVVRSRVEANNGSLTITNAFQVTGTFDRVLGIARATLGTITTTYDFSTATGAGGEVLG